MDTLSIMGLEVSTTIGCWDWEKAILQPLFIDLILSFDNQSAGKSDALADAIDYDALTNKLREKMLTEKNQLIESVAEKIAAWVLEDTRIFNVTVSVHKPYAIKTAKDIVITLSRSRTI